MQCNAHTFWQQAKNEVNLRAVIGKEKARKDGAQSDTLEEEPTMKPRGNALRPTITTSSFSLPLLCCYSENDHRFPRLHCYEYSGNDHHELLHCDNQRRRANTTDK